MSSMVGIDEAGRGPLAGPVAVGVAVISQKFNIRFFQGIKDSKKLSEKKREVWYDLAVEARERGELDFHVALISEKVIDKHGITYAIRLGITQGLEKLSIKKSAQIFLDGSLKAPTEFKNQKTIIKGDEKIAVISLASICAKVTRDRHMVKISKKFPQFSFDINKGYGTRTHIQAIKKYGPTPLHRQSFLKNLTKA